jgi:filamentous hemagglutinin
MNKNCFRIVFNPSRGQLMAVAENTHAHGAPGQGQSQGSTGPLESPGQRNTLWAMQTLAAAALLGMGLAAPLHAQIIADPSAPAGQRPTILSDGSRPLINIQTPSGGGVSRNTYSQFDVQSNGAILNNSRASNPWLATGEARVILNEVNSSNPSYLRGQVTVNGSSAQVVIANPSGLKIDGASFVNASRVTLTTGTAIMDAGALKALQIERGAIDIDGSGLNVQGVPYTEILSRTAKISARASANASDQITLITGANSLDYASGQVSPQSATSPAPALAIDASALGGMYAGRITLLATEAGVGVRNAGALQAASQLLLTADGQLTNTGSMSAPVVSLGTVSGDIVQSGAIQASSAVFLSSGSGIQVFGQGMAQAAGSAVVLSANKGIDLNAGARISSTATGGRVTLGAQQAIVLSSGSAVAAAGDVALSSDTQLTLSGAQLQSNASVNLLAGGGITMSSSTVNALAIQLETGKALQETNAAVNLSSNTLQSTGNLTVLATGNLSTASNSMTAGGHLHLGSSRSAVLANDTLRAGSLEIIGSSVTSNSIDAAASTGALKISSSAGGVDLRGTANQHSRLSAGTDLLITALGGDARLASVQATADHIKVNATGDTRLSGTNQSNWRGKWTTEVMQSSLNARKSLMLSTVGTGKTLDLGRSSLQAATEDVSLTSAGSIAMGSASVLATQGSVSAVSAGTISGVGSGALRAGQNLSIDAGQGSLILSPSQAAQLSAGQDLSLRARTGLLRLDGWGGWGGWGNSRVSLAARDLSLQGASVDLLGTRLAASRDLRITATDGSVNITALENSVNQGGYVNRYMQGAEFTAARDLQITSAGHISAQGLSARAAGDLRMQAAAALDLAGTSNRVDRFDGFWTIKQRLVNTGTLSAGGGMLLSAGTDLRLDAVRAHAGGALSINALGDVRLDASQNWTEMTGTTVQRSKRRTTTTHHLRESITTAPTELSAASVKVSAGNALSTYGTRITSRAGRTDLQAGTAANYYAVYDQNTIRDDSRRTSSFLGIRYASSRSSSSRVESTPLVTWMQSEAELISRSGWNTLLQGTQVSAAGGYAFAAGVGEKARGDARIILEGVKTTVQESKTAKSDYVVWQKQSGSGSTTQTMALPTFAGGGTFTAPGGISVQIPEGDFKSQIQSLSAQPGMGYLNDLASRKDVNWQAVKLAHDQWSYSQEGLTPAGAALLAVAVAAATGGAGASLLGTTGTVTSAMANAAFTSLAAQASITLVNNKGDVGKTLKDLSNSSTVKATLAAALTAGVLEKVGGTSTMTELSKTGQFADKLTYNLINATGRALTTTAINGGDLQGALKAALVGGMVDTAHGQAASVIGQNVSDYLSHKLAHALAGCVAGAAAGGQCKDGAIGGAIGEVVAEMFKGQAPSWTASQAEWDAFDAKVKASGKLVAGAIAAYAGGNAQTAITTAEVAIDNNSKIAFRIQAMQQGVSQQQFYINMRVQSLQTAVRESGGSVSGSMVSTGQRVNHSQSDVTRLEVQLRGLNPTHQLLYSQPSTTLSPLPYSYVNMQTAVNMNNVVGASSTNAFGFNRDSIGYFKLLIQQQPQMFSATNRDNVLIHRRAPTVDSQWIQHNPAHQSFRGETLVHHHWMQGNTAVAIPTSVHKSWNQTLHPYR